MIGKQEDQAPKRIDHPLSVPGPLISALEQKKAPEVILLRIPGEIRPMYQAVLDTR